METRRFYIAAVLVLGFGLLVLVMAVLLVASAPSISHASPLDQVGNPCGYGFQIDVIPPLPTTNDTFSVAYSAEWPHLPTPEHQSYEIVGNVIRLDAVYYAPEIWLPVMMGWGGEVGVGNLPSGTYRVDVYLTTVMTPTVFPPELCGTQSFTVYEELQQEPEDLYVAHTGTDSGNCTNSNAPCRTVQYAVDQASEGSAIKVASGVYTGVQGRSAPPGYDGPSIITQVVYVSKTVTIQGGYTTTNWSTSNPISYPTTLDALGDGRVLFITGDPSAGSGQAITPTIEGLRITGGDAAILGGGPLEGEDAGGGVYVVSATATISNNRVFNNIVLGFGGFLGFGGGLYLSDSDATLNRNTVTSNTAGSGGGLYLYYSPATLSGNIIFSNTVTGIWGAGGGVVLMYSDATLNDNSISANAAAMCGGLCLAYSATTLDGNAVSANVASDIGGGVYLWESDAILNGNTISANTADYGGGVVLYAGAAVLNNNVVADNQVNSAGSGLYIGGNSFLRLLHTTIAQNTGGDGSGVHVDSGSAVMTNTILVSHTVGITVATGSTATLEATLWGEGAWANAADWGGDGTVITGTVNLWGGPVFVDPDAGDYHIGVDSAAFNAGVDAGVAEDIDGDPRTDGHPDIGADELQSALIVVKQADPSTVEAGARLTYTIRVTNTGSLDLHATITDTLPFSVTLVGTVLLPGRTVVLPDGMVGITWTTVITAPDSAWRETIVVTVAEGYEGLLTNLVEVTTEEGATGTYTETSTVVAGQRAIYLPLVLRNR